MEALLRPPVEITVGSIAVLSGALLTLGPQYFMMTPPVAKGSAMVLCIYGAWWINKGMLIVRYQRNLRRQKRFSMSSMDIPLSNRLLYLGRGFAWTEKHTQRLHDTRRSRLARFVEPHRLVRWYRTNEYRWQSLRLSKWLAWDNPINPFRPLPPIGGNPVLHGVELAERDVHLPLADRNGHLLVLGTTRVGKTRQLEIQAIQDIRRGEVVIVFDPKGDADLLRTMYDTAHACGRGDEFYLFHLGYPDISARYNGVGQFHRVTEVASRLSGQLSGEGQSAVFREFVWRFANTVAKAVVALGARPDYRTILKRINNIDGLFVDYAESFFGAEEEVIEEVRLRERCVDPQRLARHLQGRERRVVAWEEFLMESGRGDEVLEGLRSAFKYEKSYFDKIVASLLPLLEKLTTGKTAALLSPDYFDLTDERPIFDWQQIVNQRGIVYVGLDALSDPAVAAAVGNSMFADLVSFAGSRYKHGDAYGLRRGVEEFQRPIVCHMDEFNELMGDEFIPMVNKGGGAGLQISAYSQTYSDIEAKTGSAAKAEQVAGNFNSLIMLRVKDVKTASLLTDQLPQVNVNEITLIAGYNDSSDPDSVIDFTSRHEDRITTIQTSMLEPHDVTKLPKGQAFALLEGGNLYKVRLPLPANSSRKSRSKLLGRSFEEITRDMKKKYRTSTTWWMSDGAANADYVVRGDG